MRVKALCREKCCTWIRRPFPALTEIIHERHAADHVPHLSWFKPDFLSVFSVMKQRFI